MATGNYLLIPRPKSAAKRENNENQTRLSVTVVTLKGGESDKNNTTGDESERWLDNDWGRMNRREKGCPGLFREVGRTALA